VSITDEKRALRRRILSLRDALNADDIRERSAQIARRVTGLQCYRAARTRLLFASFGSEVRTDALLAEALASEVRLILPRVVGGHDELALHEVVDFEADLAPGTWGIPEPIAERCPEVALCEVDFILVPGVAFDRRGGRLGYSGGFYDRILRARLDLIESGAAVAIGFALQIVDRVPRHEGDVLVPFVVTEDELVASAT
jgi:5-formyltetrahydrofolate cyclo-ligase